MGAAQQPRILVGGLPTSSWMTFRASMLEVLSPGTFSLRQKSSITPQPEGTQYCSVEDQLMFADVDKMERDLLDTVIQAKIRELNVLEGKPKMLVHTGTYSKMEETGANGKSLVIFNRKNFDNPKVRQLVKDLAGLLEMAYDQILIPVIGK